MKRLMDVMVAMVGLIVMSPLLGIVLFLVWFRDRHSPLYIAPRVGKNRRIFKMVKIRSMVLDADKSGVDSTAGNDARVTAIGRFVRRYKIDELSQLWNVLIGDMSLVGPRPNVERDVNLYTQEETKLLNVKPGITDFSSIVFSDEGEILRGHEDPDLSYNQLIRPWKSRLGIFYIENSSLALDIKIIVLTLLTMINRKKVLGAIAKTLRDLGAPDELVRVSQREDTLQPMPPPGATEVATNRVSNQA